MRKEKKTNIVFKPLESQSHVDYTQFIQFSLRLLKMKFRNTLEDSRNSAFAQSGRNFYRKSIPNFSTLQLVTET